MVAVTQAGGPYGRGAFRFDWRGAAITAKITEAVLQAMDETADAAKSAAQERCPVDTGRLRDSIDAIVDQSGGSQRRRLTLFAAAPYALYVELGTSRMAAQPFLRPAMDAEAPKLTQRIRAAIGSTR
jgi:HK97 gp10 family phage protein